MIIFSSQRELGVVLCNFTLFPSVKLDSQQGRGPRPFSGTWSTLSRTTGLDAQFPFGAYVRNFFFIFFPPTLSSHLLHLITCTCHMCDVCIYALLDFAYTWIYPHVGNIMWLPTSKWKYANDRRKTTKFGILELKLPKCFYAEQFWIFMSWWKKVSSCETPFLYAVGLRMLNDWSVSFEIRSVYFHIFSCLDI